MRRRVARDAECEHIGRETNYNDLARLKWHFKDASFDNSSFYSSIGSVVVLALLYLPFVLLARKAMYQGFVVPLPENASLHQISAGRTLRHIHSLAKDIGVRQEGSKGLHKAAIYIREELDALQRRAAPELRVDVDELLVSGSFNMVILGHSVALAYRDHLNLVIRLSGKDADNNAPSVLVNGHFDGPLGSPGAADCASCVASMLEVIRYIVDTNWVPPSPVLFLFNGAEELFLLGAHGFVKNYKAWSSIGAVINVEASGASGPDIVVQSGPGAWPSRVYAEYALYPMANSIAQDVFPLIPGDTDYRIFTQDHGDVPGLDIIFVLEGYVYHTGDDKPENIVPGSLQARGENLFALVSGFTTAPELQASRDRALTLGPWKSEARPTFFDLFGLVMIYYTQQVASALHILPLIVVVVVIAFTSVEELPTVSKRLKFVWQGLVLQVSGLILAVILPAALAVARLSMSKSAMTWFAQPWIAFLMHVPLAVGGLLIPRVALSAGIKRPTIGREALDWSNHWGAVGLNALVAALFTILGYGSGYFPFWWAIFMIPALSVSRIFQGFFGEHSIVSMVGYILPAALPASYTVYFGGVFIQFVTEKMGMSGTFPQPLGFYVADVIVAVVTATVAALAISPIIPVVGNWIAKPHSLRLLVYISIGSAALSAGMFPYSVRAPKRVIFQQTIKTEENKILESTYDFASVDPNPMSFVFIHSPEVAKKLQLELSFSEETIHFADPVTWMALFPISRLFSRGPKIPAPTTTLLKEVKAFPRLYLVEVQSQDDDFDSRRVHMRLDLGSLGEVWAAVINVTGPISSWSFAERQLPAPEISYGGPPSYMCRLSGPRDKEDWHFWLETNGSDPLRVELGVLDQFLDNDAEALIHLFPSWAAVTAATSYISSYEGFTVRPTLLCVEIAPWKKVFQPLGNFSVSSNPLVSDFKLEPMAAAALNNV